MSTIRTNNIKSLDGLNREVEKLVSTSPVSVTDGGTDAFAGDFGRDISSDEAVKADFGSANTTTTPTLENTGGDPSGAITCTTKGGSALWANALSGVHELQYASSGPAWRVVDPNPVSTNDANATVKRDSNGRAKFVDPSADQDAATKGWALAAPGSSTDPSLAFDTWRTPNADRPTLITVSFRMQTDGANPGEINIFVDEDGGTSGDYSFPLYIDDRFTASTNGFVFLPMSFIIAQGASYLFENTGDPSGSNDIEAHREYTL